MTHTITIEESDRQAILLALAKLSIERPGWLHYLNEIALKMDNKTADGAEMFQDFRRLAQAPTMRAAVAGAKKQAAHEGSL